MIKNFDRRVVLTSNFVLAIKNGKYYIVKNRLYSKEGLVSKKTVRNILKRLSERGFGSSTWIIKEI